MTLHIVIAAGNVTKKKFAALIKVFTKAANWEKNKAYLYVFCFVFSPVTCCDYKKQKVVHLLLYFGSIWEIYLSLITLNWHMDTQTQTLSN